MIVRKGQLKTTADIDNITPIKDDAGQVKDIHFTLHREGDFSLYGNVELYEKSDDDLGKRIGFIRGIALYDPTVKRLVRLHLDEAQNLSGKALQLRFEENKKYGGSNIVEKDIIFN